MINLHEAIAQYLDGEERAFTAIALEHYRYINDKYFCQLWRILDIPQNDIIGLNMLFSLLESFHSTFLYGDKKKYEWYKCNVFKQAKDWKSLSDLRNAISHTVSPSSEVLINAGLIGNDPRRYMHNIENIYVNTKALFEEKMIHLINGEALDSEKCTFLFNLLRFEDDQNTMLKTLATRIIE